MVGPAAPPDIKEREMNDRSENQRQPISLLAKVVLVLLAGWALFSLLYVYRPM